MYRRSWWSPLHSFVFFLCLFSFYKLFFLLFFLCLFIFFFLCICDFLVGFLFFVYFFPAGIGYYTCFRLSEEDLWRSVSFISSSLRYWDDSLRYIGWATSNILAYKALFSLMSLLLSAALCLLFVYLKVWGICPISIWTGPLPGPLLNIKAPLWCWYMLSILSAILIASGKADTSDCSISALILFLRPWIKWNICSSEAIVGTCRSHFKELCSIGSASIKGSQFVSGHL